MPDGDMGIGVIEVPAQIAKHKYFLTAKVVEGDSQVKEIVFGLSRRRSSSSNPLAIDDLHRLMQSGKNPVPETLTRLEDKIDILLHAQINAEPLAESAADLLNERIDNLFSDGPESE
jgi:hypothetical protein